MEKRTFEWNGDFQACRAEADAGKFDKELALLVGKRMYQAYRLERLVDKPLKVGWSICTSETFDLLWTRHPRLKNLSEHDAKVLFLAGSDIFHHLEFGGRTIDEKRKDLKKRISRLAALSAELELHAQKLTDNPDDAEALEAEYQALFIETVRIYAD
ncbi:MAG: hypothetical protein OXU51_11570 [Candidatus Poribacteria bacterium]|nr:hypothetical protein [Candidatus Poribacteria bacterium]